MDLLLKWRVMAMRMKCTQIEMLRDRGYEIGQNELFFLQECLRVLQEEPKERRRPLLLQMLEKYESVTAYIMGKAIQFPQSLSRVYLSRELPPTYVRYVNSLGSTSAEANREIVNMELSSPIGFEGGSPELKMGPFGRFIFICMDNEEPGKEMREFAIPGVKIEQFTWKQMCFNVTKHCLVPKHLLFTGADKDREIATSLGGIEKVNLPGILETDPVARYYGAEVGDLFRIERMTTHLSLLRKTYYWRMVRDEKIARKVTARKVEPNPIFGVVDPITRVTK